MQQPNNRLTTSDLKTASFLISKKVPLLKVDKSRPRKVNFIFERTPLVNKLLDLYWKGKAETNVRLLFESLDQLKDAIFRDYDI